MQIMYEWLPRKGHVVYILKVTEVPAGLVEWSKQIGGSFERYKDKKFGKDIDLDPLNISPLYGHITVYTDTGNEVLSPADGCFLWNLRSPLSGGSFDTAAQNYWSVALQLNDIVNSGGVYASSMDRLNHIKLDLRNKPLRKLLVQKNGLSGLPREMIKTGFETLGAEFVDLYRHRDKVCMPDNG